MACDDTSAMQVNDEVTGVGIDVGTRVLGVLDATHFLLSAPATQTLAGGSAITFTEMKPYIQLLTCTTAVGSTDVTSPLSNTSNLQVGMALTGLGLGYGSTVAGFAVPDSTHLTLSTPALWVFKRFDGLDVKPEIRASVTLSATVPSSVPMTAAGGGVVQLIGGNFDLRNAKYTSIKTLSLDGGRLRGLVGNSLWQGPTVANVSSTIEVGPGASLDLVGGISGRSGITKVGFGTLALEGTNTFSGGMNVNEGTLQLDYTTNHAGKLADNSTLTLGGGRKGATLDVIGNATGNTEVVSQVVLSLGQNRITRTDPASRTALRLNAITINQGATLDVEYDVPATVSGVSTTSGSATITVGTTAGLIPGVKVVGSNIPANTTILQILNATTVVLSNKATGTASGISLTIPTGNSTPFTATTDRPNDGATANSSSGILGPWATVNLSDWAANQINTSTPNDGPIVPYTQYSIDDWSGSKANVNVTKGSKQTGTSAYTLRFATNAPTITELNGDIFLTGGGILQAPAAGAVNNIITGGRLVLGNNFQGGNLVIRQNDTQGALQIDSVIANAFDVVLNNAVSYGVATGASTTGFANNRIVLNSGNTNDFYTGMPVIGPNIRPGSTINAINNTGIGGTVFQISQNLASPLTFGQGASATPPPATVFKADLLAPRPVTYNANTRVGGVPGVNNQIHLTDFNPPTVPLVLGQIVTGPGIPAGTTITAIVPTTPAGTDFLLSNDVPLQVAVDLTFGPVQGVNNQIRVYFVGDPTPFSNSPQPINVGELVTEAGTPTGVIAPGTVVTSIFSSRLDANNNRVIDYLLNNDIVQVPGANLTGVNLQFTVWGELTINNAFTQIVEDIGTPGSPNLINTFQVHIVGGFNFGLAKDQTVTGLGIPANATIFKLIGTTDFTYTFPPSRALKIGTNTSFVGDIGVANNGVGTNGLQIHLTTGTTTGLLNNTSVEGADIQPGSFITGLVPGGTDFTISRSIFAPVVDMTVQGRNGLLKSGDGVAQLTGANTFTGPVNITGGTLSVADVADGGFASTLGSGTVAAGNLTIGGGTLQYTGNTKTVNRGFTINEVGAIDVSYAGSTLNFTGNLSGGGGAALGTLQKNGMGTLQLSRTVTAGGATNFGAFDVQNGTLRLKYNNPNDGNPNDRFASTAAGLTLGGGKFELAGLPDTPSASNLSEDRSQTLKGQLTLNTGASQIWATSAPGTNITLNLQDPAAPQDVIRAPGATVVFAENTNGGLSSSITLATNPYSLGSVLPWAVYMDTPDLLHPIVNNFAEIEILDNGIIPADSRGSSYSYVSKLTDWSFGDVTETESGAPFSGTLITQSGVMKVDGLRFYSILNGAVTMANPISTDITTAKSLDTLVLSQGAILAATHSGGASKTIQGGQLTSALEDFGTLTNDLLIHNYNPAHALEISSAIVDYKASSLTPTRQVNLVISGNGTTIIDGSDAAKIWTFNSDGTAKALVTNPNYLKNTYTGSTYLTGGVLLVANPNALPGGLSYSVGSAAVGSNVVFAGGVLGLKSDFNRSLGANNTQIQWTSSGGFAAYGTLNGVVQVNLGAPTVASTPPSLIWGSGGFVPDSNELRLGAADSTGNLRILNPINLGGVGRVVNVADGFADTDAELAGGLSGNGGSLRKTGQGTLRLSGGQGTQTGGAVLGQGKLSTSAASLGTGPLGIGNTSSSNAQDSLVLELRGGTFNSLINVGNVNSQGITSINAVASPALNGAMSLDRNIFFGPQQGRKITIGGGMLDTTTVDPVTHLSTPTGNGSFTMVDGGVVVLNGAGTLGSKDVVGPGGKKSVVLRSGSVYVGNSNALGNIATGFAVVQMGDTPANRQFVVDRSTAGRSMLAQGGVYNQRSNGIPGTGNGRGAFLFSDQQSLVIDGNTYVEKDCLVDGDITQGVGPHKRTLILVNGESDAPDRNGLYQLVYHYGDPISLTNCATSVTTTTVKNASLVLNSTSVSVNTTGLVPGMVISGTGIQAGAKIVSIVDPFTFTMDLRASNTASGVTLSFALGTTTVTCSDTSLLVPGMPLYGQTVPTGTVVNNIVNSSTFIMSNRAISAGSGMLFTARDGDTISLGRIVEFDEPSEMVYGVRVQVTNGTDAGKSYFLAEDVNVSFDETYDPAIPTYTPVWWKQDLLKANVAFLANTAGLTIGNSIDISVGTDVGSMSLGGSSSLGAGSSTFSGNVVLQNGSVALLGCATTVNSPIVTTSSTAKLAVGMGISGTNIPAASKVVSVTDGSTFVISNNATATATGLTLVASYPSTTQSIRLLSDTMTGQGVVFSGIFSEAAAAGKLALQKLGTGTVTLKGANTYTGGTTVSSGTLLVDNSAGSGTGTGKLSVLNYNTSLGGIGSVSGATSLTSGALLSPGDPALGGSHGTLTFGGDLTLGAGSSALFELGGADSDQVVVGGRLTVDPSVVLHVLLDYIPTATNTFDLISWNTAGSGLDLVNSLDLPALVTNQFYWDTSTFNTDGILRLKNHIPNVPVARFAVRSAQAAEVLGGMELRLAVQLDSPAVASLDVPIKITGTATIGSDYDLVMGASSTTATTPTQNLHFNTGDTSSVITIKIHDDPILEPTESVVLTIVEPSTVPKTVLKGSPGTFTLTIADNDGSTAMGSQWTLQNPLPTNEKLMGVATAVTALTPTQVTTTVAVGSSGAILYTSDGGVTWNKVLTGIKTSFNAVAAHSAVGSSPAAFVAVGDGGLVMTSPDGVVWTYHSTSGDKALHSVVWANSLSLFVAVGDKGIIYSSLDGTNWIYQASGVTFDLAAVTFANSLLVAVGQNGAVTTSDGVPSSVDQSQVWTSGGNAGATTYLRGISFRAGVYVAVGDGGVVTTSADGLTWTKVASSGISADLRAVYPDSSNLYAVGVGGALYKSTNGTTWIASGTASVTDDLLAGGVTTGNKSLVVGNSGIMVTNNAGVTWSRLNLASGPNVTTTQTLNTVAFNGTRFVATGVKGSYARADHLDDFTQSLQGLIGNNTVQLTAMAPGSGSQLVAVGYSGAAFVSTDGTTWAATSGTGVTTNLRGITYAGGNYYAVGDVGTLLKGVASGTTTPVITWTVITTNTPENLSGIAFSGSLWIAVGGNGTVLTSLDGQTWDDASPGGLPALSKVIWTGSQFIIIGAGGTVLTTTDAAVFTRMTTNNSASLSDIVWTDLGAFVVGDSGTILQSSLDALTWQTVSSGTGQNLRGIAWDSGDARLVAVGESGTILSSKKITAPNPAVYFANTEMTVDERSGVAQVPLFFTQIPTHDLYLSYSLTGTATSGKDYTAASPLKIPVSGITQAELAAGALTRYIPISVIGDVVKNEGTETVNIKLNSFVVYDSKGKPVLNPDKSPKVDTSADVIDPFTCVLNITDTVAPTVNFNPSVQHQMIGIGDHLQITSTITGSGPTVVWTKNGAVVPKVTTDTYDVLAATTAVAGAYAIKVSNPAGSDSTNRTGLVAPAGTVEVSVIDKQDRLVLVKPKTSIALTEVTGGNGLSYVWSVGSLTASDYTAAGNKLTIKLVDIGVHEGDYSCTVTQNGSGHNTGVSAVSGIFHVKAALVPDIAVPSTIPTGKVGAPYTLKIPRTASGDPLNPDPLSPSTPASFTALGLPTGLNINAAGLISGTPTVSGSKTVTVSATNVAGTTKLSTFVINIDPIEAGALGTFVGLADRIGSPDKDVNTQLAYGTLGLGARFDLTTTNTSTYTGRLTVGTLGYSFGGKLLTSATGDPSPHNPQGTAMVVRGAGKSTLTVNFTIDPTTGVVTGTVTDSNTTAGLNGWRNGGTVPVANINTMIDIPGGPPGDGSRPEGVTYATVAVTATGTVTVSGKTAEGFSLTTAGVFGLGGQVLVYQPFYTITGTMCGQLIVNKTNAAVLPVTGNLTWSHPSNAIANRTYVAGWPNAPVALEATGGKYYPPTGTGIVLGLPDYSANADPTNAKLEFDGAGVPTTPNLNSPPATIQIKAPATVILPVPGMNPAGTTLTLVPSSGAFTGTFTLTNGTLTRKVTFQGLAVPQLSTPSDVLDAVGYGYFLLPQLPDNTAVPPTTSTTSPIRSGLVTLQKTH